MMIHYGVTRSSDWMYRTECNRVRVSWHKTTGDADKVTCPKCAAALLIASTTGAR